MLACLLLLSELPHEAHGAGTSRSPAERPLCRFSHVALLAPRQISRQSKVVSTRTAVVSVAGIASFGETLNVVATLYTSKKGDKDFSEKVH